MKNNKKYFLSVCILSSIIALLPGCWPFSSREDTIIQEPQSAAVKAQSLYVINVLDKNSYDDCHIAGSVNVPFDQIETFAKELNRNTEIVVYCSNYMCGASSQAARMLKDMGFENVWAFEGGSTQWYQMSLKDSGNYPVEGACKSSYLSAANEAPEHTDDATVAIISAEELQAKMEAHGLIKPANLPAVE